MRGGKIPDDLLNAVTESLAAATARDRNRLIAASESAPFKEHARSLLPYFNIAVLSNALWGMKRRNPTPDELELVLAGAAAVPEVGTFVDMAYGRRMLGIGDSHVSDPTASDPIDYLGRVQPMLAVLSAYAYRHSAGGLPPWQDRVQEVAKVFKRSLYRKIVRAQSKS